MEYIGYRRTPHLKVYKCVLRKRERERERRERERERERERQRDRETDGRVCIFSLFIANYFVTSAPRSDRLSELESELVV